MNRIIKSMNRMQCNPTLFLFVLLGVLGILMYHYRAAVIYAAVMTFGIMGSLFVLAGVTTLVFTLRRVKRDGAAGVTDAKPSIKTELAALPPRDDSLPLRDPVSEAEAVVRAAEQKIVSESPVQDQG